MENKCTDVKRDCICKDCSDCPNCYDLSVYEINDLLYAVDKKIVEYGCSFANERLYGHTCTNVKWSEFTKLLAYKSSLKRYHLSLYHGYEFCMCPEQVQLLVEGVRMVVDTSCCESDERTDLVIDESNLETWLLNNPRCVAFDEWESLLYRVCPVIDIKIEKVDADALCNLMYILNVEKTKNSSEILYALEVYLLNRDIDATITANPKDCSLDSKVYAQLIDCGMTHEVITTLLDCGLELSVNVEERCPVLTYDGSVEVVLCDIDFGVDSVKLICDILGIDISEQ